jgi:hypothetical protein
MNNQISPQEWQILSAYIDGQLSERERRQIEARLLLHPELRKGLDELKRTRALLRSLPKRRAVRNFTLTPAMVKPRHPQRAYPVLRLASVFASFLLILTFLGEMALNVGYTGMTSSEPAGQEAYALQAPAIPENITSQMPELTGPAEVPVPPGISGGVEEGDASPESAPPGTELRSFEHELDPTEQAKIAQTAAPQGYGMGPEETPMGMLAAPPAEPQTEEGVADMRPQPPTKRH